MEPSTSSCSTSMQFPNMFAECDGVVGHLGKLHAEVGHEQVTGNPGSIMQKS